MFINLTNHPSSAWSSEQLDEAKRRGEIKDAHQTFTRLTPTDLDTAFDYIKNDHEVKVFR